MKRLLIAILAAGSLLLPAGCAAPSPPSPAPSSETVPTAESQPLPSGLPVIDRLLPLEDDTYSRSRQGAEVSRIMIHFMSNVVNRPEDPYRMEDAEVALVLIGSSAGTAKVAVDQLREQGVKAGLVKIRVFRPFPAQELAQALQHVKALAIMDKAESFSANGGPLFSEVRGALYDLEPRPRTVGYVYGLGGRDITPAHFHTVFARLQAIAAGGELGPVYTHLGQRG